MHRARTQDAKERRRQVLLEAALDEFFERGFAAARMQDVAARAGVSKGTVYLYFDSKTDLFRALVEAFAMPNLDRIDALARSTPTFAELMTRLAAFAPDLVGRSRLPKLMKVLVGDSHAFPDVVSAYRRDIIDRVIAALTAAVERAVASGEIATRDAHLTARLIVAPIAMSGLWQAVFAGSGGPPVDLERLFALHADTLTSALSTQRGS